MADAMMKHLGEANGVKWYWAEPGKFEKPGVYYWNGTSNVLCVPVAAAPPSPPAEQQGGSEVEWGSTKTVGQLIRQLQTFDPETPITAATHADYKGKRTALARPLVMSRERVEGRFIRQGDESVPYSLVIWSGADESAEQPRQMVALTVDVIHAQVDDLHPNERHFFAEGVRFAERMHGITTPGGKESEDGR